MIDRTNCRCFCHSGGEIYHIVPCCHDSSDGLLTTLGKADGLGLNQGYTMIEAAMFATEAHNEQYRKYTHRPYIEHPMRVASAIMMKGGTPELVSAAWLHDVVEDCGITHETIKVKFGTSIATLVAWMTNPSKQHPKLSRADKKAMDREHWSKIEWAPAHWLKAEDRLDNLRDAWQGPAEWRQMYAQESIRLLDELRLAPSNVREDAYSVAYQLLGIS